MPFSRGFSVGRPRGAWLVGLVGLLALPAHAQPEGASAATARSFFAPVTERTIFTVGWQAGQYDQHGMGNMYYHALRLHRDPNTASVEKRMDWGTTYGGPTFCVTTVRKRLTLDFRWSNRHTIRSARWTDQAGVAWTTGYRVRLNELSLGLGYPLWGGRLRPGLACDLGIFRVSRRDGQGKKRGKWHSMHANEDGLLAPGERSPTVGMTLYADVAPLSTTGGGLTLRPYYQWHVMEPDLFGLAGTFDTRSFQYGIHNYGLALSWGFTSK